MSFDLKITNGDIRLSSSGEVALVRNDEKLRQDILKIVLTPIGRVKAHPWYGSALGSGVIGRILEQNILKLETESTINFAINNLIKLQQDQERFGQFLSPSEAISNVIDLRVEQSRFDGRQYNIILSVATRRNNVITESFALTT